MISPAARRRSVSAAALLAVASLPGTSAERTGIALDKAPHALLVQLVPRLQFGFYKQPADIGAHGATLPPSSDPKDLSGRYSPQEATLLLPGERGRMASHTDRGARTFLSRAEEVLAGRLRNDPAAQCKPEGSVRALSRGFTVQVLQSPTQIVLIHMEGHLVRRIRIGGGTAAAAAAKPSFAGTSVGHWEGNTLVVETRSVRAGSWLDEYGDPGSERLMLTERYTKQPNGSLRLEATINDPLNYLEPIRIVRSWNWTPNAAWHESICEEHIHDLAVKRP